MACHMRLVSSSIAICRAFDSRAHWDVVAEGTQCKQRTYVYVAVWHALTHCRIYNVPFALKTLRLLLREAGVLPRQRL